MTSTTFFSACLAASVTCALPGYSQADDRTAVRHTEGVVEAIKDVVVSAPDLKKRIVAVLVDEGMEVRQGQPLANLEATIEKLEMQRFAKVLEKREFENDVAAKLAKDKIISRDEELERSLELDIARLQFEVAEEKHNLNTITSPIDGVVVEKLKEEGESVVEGEAMFQLVDVSRVFVRFYLAAREISLVGAGDALVVEFPDLAEEVHRFEGVVAFVSPVVDASSGLRRVKLLIENPDGLIKAGIRGVVEIPAPVESGAQ